MSMRLSRSIVGEAEAEAVRRVIVEDGYLGMGHETCLFEQELAALSGRGARTGGDHQHGHRRPDLAVDAIARAMPPASRRSWYVLDLRGLLPGHRGRRLRTRGLRRAGGPNFIDLGGRRPPHHARHPGPSCPSIMRQQPLASGRRSVSPGNTACASSKTPPMPSAACTRPQRRQLGDVVCFQL